MPSSKKRGIRQAGMLSWHERFAARSRTLSRVGLGKVRTDPIIAGGTITVHTTSKNVTPLSNKFYRNLTCGPPQSRSFLRQKPLRLVHVVHPVHPPPMMIPPTCARNPRRSHSPSSAVRAMRNGAALAPLEMKSTVEMVELGSGLSQVNLNRRTSN